MYLNPQFFLKFLLGRIGGQVIRDSDITYTIMGPILENHESRSAIRRTYVPQTGPTRPTHVPAIGMAVLSITHISSGAVAVFDIIAGRTASLIMCPLHITTVVKALGNVHTK